MNSAKQLAQDAAKRAVREPLEILKEAKEQITGSEQVQQPTEATSQQPAPAETEKKIPDNHLYEALEQEIAEIRAKKEEKERERLQQEEVAEKPKLAPIVQPTGKRGRDAKISLGAKRQMTQTEAPLPPSG